MKQTAAKLTTPADPSEVPGVSRRSFLARASVGAIAMSPFSGLANAIQDATPAPTGTPTSLNAGDKAILIAAEIAEALAVTTYTNIIDRAPFFKNIRQRMGIRLHDNTVDL